MTTSEAIKKIESSLKVNHIYAHTVYSQIAKPFTIEKAALIIGEKAKPFVKWVGGKRQLLKQFHDMGLYPPTGFDPTKNTYFEPFLGGGAVFFDLLPKKAFLSDLNYELVIAYKTIRDDVENLIVSLKKHQHDKNYYLKVRKQTIDKKSEIEIASRFIFLNKTSFRGMYRVNSKGGFNVPFGNYINPRICDEINLRKVSEALKQVSITHGDFKQNLQQAKKGDFIYLDPPYYPVSKTASFTSYTTKSFLKKEQLELRDLFYELHKKGCLLMLSNSDTPFINQIYSELKDKKIKINKVIAGRTINAKAARGAKINEVLITNY
jgi:DNA adenine methylase